MNKFKSIDLFAGCGGLMDGFEQSGFYETLAVVEWEKAPCRNIQIRLRDKWNYTDSLAHLTYPLRYISGKYGIKVDLTKFDDVINTIFETLIYNKKALELNVSTLNTYHHEPMPTAALIKRFHDMGGKYVTVGTDSHRTATVCDNIDKGYEILQSCGYEHFTIFVKHEPWLMPIR